MDFLLAFNLETGSVNQMTAPPRRSHWPPSPRGGAGTRPRGSPGRLRAWRGHRTSLLQSHLETCSRPSSKCFSASPPEVPPPPAHTLVPGEAPRVDDQKLFHRCSKSVLRLGAWTGRGGAAEISGHSAGPALTGELLSSAL